MTTIKKEKSKLEASLSDIKQRYKNKEVGIDYSNIEEVSEILEEYRDEEKYFKENILLATENVNAKNLALITQIAAAIASSGTYGFSVGVRADLATTKQESSLKQTSSNKSSLNAKHININSNDALAITGSDLASKEDMSLNSNNLNINSSEDSLKYKSNTRSLTTGFGFTFYGANSSSLELGTNSLKQSEQSLINNNSHLYSAKDMNINTANDATIKGANLIANERLNLKVGNNLSLESLRDKYTSNQKDFTISAGVGFSGNTKAKSNGITTTGLFDKNHFVDINTIDKSSTNANFSRSRSNTITKQTILSSITANKLNVEVGKNTHLKGSLLAAGEYDKDNTFIDNHNLNLKTNTLSYENLSNTSYAKGTNFSIGANYILEDKNNKDSKSNNNQEDKFTGLKSIYLSNKRNLSYTLSKNLATLGSGNIEIADKENSDDLDRLNKDTTKPTKDLVNTSISSNVDASMDLRVLTKSGQKDIKDEFNTATAITKAIELISTTKNAKLSSFFSYVDDLVKGYDRDKILLELNLKVIENQSASVLEKEQAASNIAAIYGVNVKFANLESYSGGKYNPEDPNSIYLNTATLGNTKTFLTALRHELAHKKDNEAGKFIPQDKFQNEFATNLALKKLDMSKKALALNGKKIDNFNLNIDKDDPAILANTNHFYSLDQSKSDDWVIAIPYAYELASAFVALSLTYVIDKYGKDKINTPSFPMDDQADQVLPVFDGKKKDEKNNLLPTPEYNGDQFDLIVTPKIQMGHDGLIIDGFNGVEIKREIYSASVNAVYPTEKEAKVAAEQLGYKKLGVFGKAVVYKKGNSYITRDLDAHNGGAWKEASSPEKLLSKKTRNGTFDKDMNKIGD